MDDSRSMQSNSGRKKVLACMQAKSPLTKFSKPDSNQATSSSVGGVPEMQAVVDIMARVKAGTTPKAGDAEPPKQASQTDEKDKDQSQDTQGADTEAACPPGDDDDDNMLINLIESEEEPEDPLLVKAKELTAQELAFVSVHRSADKWMEEISACVLKHNRAVVVLEAPTSKPAVLHQLLKLKCFPEQFSLWIPVGERLDLLHSMQRAVSSAWPKRFVYTICLGQASQSQKRKTKWGVWMPLDGEKAPGWLELHGCKTKASECLRYRCNIACCKFVKPDEAAGGGMGWCGVGWGGVEWVRWGGVGWGRVEWIGVGCPGRRKPRG